MPWCNVNDRHDIEIELTKYKLVDLGYTFQGEERIRINTEKSYGDRPREPG